MSIVVTKSPPVLVGPSEPTPAGKLALSSFDKSLVSLSFTSIHIYKCSTVQRPVETIRRALSRALVPYYPVAGRLIARLEAGEPHLQIVCTGEGVAFVAAFADSTLEDVRYLDQPLAVPLSDLSVLYGGPCPPTDPLLLMQVTEFSCGGFVVGVTWNHVIADGCGLAQFLQAIGEVARGLPSPCVAPVRQDDSFPDLPPFVTALEQSLSSCEPRNLAYSDITLPSSLIKHVKAEFYGQTGQACTSFEVVAAVLWRCRTRAINADPDAPAPLVFSANVNKYVRAKHGYYGNCVTCQAVMATCGAVANGDVMDLIKQIKHAKEQIPNQFKKGEDGGMQGDLGDLGGYNLLIVSSWRNLGFEDVDFGGGTPARIMGYSELTATPVCVTCPSCTTKDGVNVVAFCVEEGHVAAFHAELAKGSDD